MKTTLKQPFDWGNISGFNFTHAMPDGAWLRSPGSEPVWVSYAQIEKHKGEVWWDWARKKQGMFTGCWADLP